MIRPATLDDASQVAAIYNYYVKNTIVTFEEEAVSDTEMASRIAQGSSHCPWLVADTDGAVSGYAYAAPWSARTGYRSSVETTVYLAQDQTGKGLGFQLYGALIDGLRAADLHCAIGIIALPNPASVALHEKLGFQKVGEFQEIGRKLGRWINVGHWQLLL